MTKPKCKKCFRPVAGHEGPCGIGNCNLEPLPEDQREPEIELEGAVGGNINSDSMASIQKLLSDLATQQGSIHQQLAAQASEQKLIWEQLKASQQPSPDTASPPNQVLGDQEKILKQTNLLIGSGESLDTQLHMGIGKQPEVSEASLGYAGVYDPRNLLTVKSSKRKALHITQFLSEQTKTRLKNKRQDVVLARVEQSDELFLRTEDQHPYGGVTVDEWGAANLRLMNALLVSGDLKRCNIEFYMSYSASIFEFVQKYEWWSILDFDHTYREMQACHDFQWGFLNPVMELQILVPKNRKPKALQQGSSGNTQQRQQICRQFLANGSCRFGSSCRYKHVEANNQMGRDQVTVQGAAAPKNGWSTISQPR